jgi:transposase InsO family protein
MFVNPLRNSTMSLSSSDSDSSDDSQLNKIPEFHSNSASPAFASINDAELSVVTPFVQWLLNKKDSLTKTHCILTKMEYLDIVRVVDDLPSAKKDPSLSWAISYIKNHNIHKYVNSDGRITPGHEVVVPNGSGSYLRIAYLEMIENAIHSVHLACGHKKSRITYEKLSSLFINIRRIVVEQFCRYCVICTDTKAITKRAPKTLHPILANDIFEHLVIDLVDYSQTPSNGYKYILHIVDHQSSYHFVYALVSKEAKDVLEGLRQTFQFISHPKVIQSDNGGEFNNDLLSTYFEKYNISHRNSKPYTPSTNGKVERGNRDLQNIIDRLMKEYNCDWFNVLYEAALIMNTTYTSSLKMSPHEFVFARKPRNETNGIIDLTTLVDISDASSNSSKSSSPSSVLISSQIPHSIPLPSLISQLQRNVDDSNELSRINLQEHALSTVESINTSTLSSSIQDNHHHHHDDNNTQKNDLVVENRSIIDILASVAENYGEGSATAIENNNLSNAERIESKYNSDDEKDCESSIVIRCERENIFQRVRNTGKTAYVNNSLRMVKQVNAQRKARDLGIGEAVGMYIPQDYKRNGINRLPALIINKKIVKGSTKYQLVHRKHLIDGWYEVNEFASIEKDAYSHVIGAGGELDIKEYQQLISRKKLISSPLRTVYISYISNYSTFNRQNQISKRAGDVHHLDRGDGEPGKKQRLSNVENEFNVENVCAACSKIIYGNIFNSCAYCRKSIHPVDFCPKKKDLIVQEYTDGGRNSTTYCYCSSNCFLKKNAEEDIQVLSDDESVSSISHATGSNHHDTPVSFRTGTLAFLNIPEQLRGHSDVRKIPVVILERDFCDDDEEELNKYSVGIKGFTVQGWFYHSQLEEDGSKSISPALFGLKKRSLQKNQIDCWGFVDDRKKKVRAYKFVTFESAIQMFSRFGDYNNVEDVDIIYDNASNWTK